GVKLPKPMARPAELTCPITPSDGVLESLAQLADPVMDADMEVSVPLAGLNCATDVPANSLLPENDNVAAGGPIVIVKFSVMVSALAAGANIAAATASAAPSFDFMSRSPSETTHRSRRQRGLQRSPVNCYFLDNRKQKYQYQRGRSR